MNFGLANAIISLRPGEQWILNGDDYSGLEWLSETEIPTEEELFAEINRLQSEYDLMEYSRLRASEYPSMNDYLDGIVKGDQAQVDAYIAACLAVKEKYPKPS
jgi:hypothetical protein